MATSRKGMAEEFLEGRRKHQEETYFRQQDRRLLEKMRAKADQERKHKEREQRKQAHWMKCPKCGHDMHETHKGEVKVDRCGNCGGIYLDAGELDILLAVSKETVFHRWFRKKKKRSS